MKTFLKNKIFKGFTLAEVLISIGIAGVIGAILIPVVNKGMPDPNIVKYRKAYLTTQKVVQKLLADDNIYPSDNMTQVSGIGYPTGLALMTDPTLVSGSTGKFCYYFVRQLNIVGDANCPTTSWNGSLTNIATTTDGIVWYLSSHPTIADFKVEAPVSSHYYLKVIVDVNGTTLGPNCTTDSNGGDSSFFLGDVPKCADGITNPDMFAFGIRYDGKIRVANSSVLETSTAVTDTKAQTILSNSTENTK